MKYTGVVKDPENEMEPVDNTFTVEAKSQAEAAESIAKAYVAKYKMCRRLEVAESTIEISGTIYSFDYYESWQYLVYIKPVITAKPYCKTCHEVYDTNERALTCC